MPQVMTQVQLYMLLIAAGTATITAPDRTLYLECRAYTLKI